MNRKYSFPDIDDIEYALETIYEFYISEKYPDYTYNEFVNEYDWKNVKFLHISTESNKKIGIIAMKLYGYGEIFLDYIIIFPEYRNNGIGTEVINVMQRSFPRITLRASFDKINFYKKLNFKIDETSFDIGSKTIPMVWYPYSEFEP